MSGAGRAALLCTGAQGLELSNAEVHLYRITSSSRGHSTRRLSDEDMPSTEQGAVFCLTNRGITGYWSKATWAWCRSMTWVSQLRAAYPIYSARVREGRA